MTRNLSGDFCHHADERPITKTDLVSISMPRLIEALAELFPGSAHVAALGFAGETPDEIIWRFAGQHGFAVLTSEHEFLTIAERPGHPPQVIRLEKMNYRTKYAVDLLRRNAIRIAEFSLNDQAVLVLRLR